MAERSGSGLSANLVGQVAIVTGASRGLGKAVAVELARNGARVACIARDSGKLSILLRRRSSAAFVSGLVWRKAIMARW